MAVSSTSINEDFRKNAPEAGPIPSIDIGSFETLELENGLRIIVVENSKLPKVAFNLVVSHDPVYEGPIAGCSEITGEMTVRGTRTRSKTKIDDQIDYYGAKLQSGSSGVYGSVLKRHLDHFLTVFCDVVMNATFPEAEFEKIKLKHQSRLQTVRNEPSDMAYHVRSTVNFYDGHPYGDTMTEESLGALSVRDCREYYESYWNPGCSYLAIVGDISVDEVKQVVAPRLSLWNSNQIPKHTYEKASRPKQNTLCVVDRPNAVQSEVHVTYPVDFHPASADRIPATVMNHILGGGAFSGYLMSNLREDKGFTYGVRSQLSMDPVDGEFQIATSVGTEVSAVAVREIFHEMNRIRQSLVDQKHLELARNALIGSFARSIENPQNLAHRVLNMMRFGLPVDFYQKFTGALTAVSSDDVMEMANRYILPDNANIVIVGNWKQMESDFMKTIGECPVMMFDAFGRRI